MSINKTNLAALLFKNVPLDNKWKKGACSKGFLPFFFLLVGDDLAKLFNRSKPIDCAVRDTLYSVLGNFLSPHKHITYLFKTVPWLKDD